MKMQLRIVSECFWYTSDIPTVDYSSTLPSSTELGTGAGAGAGRSAGLSAALPRSVETWKVAFGRSGIDHHMVNMVNMVYMVDRVDMTND